MTTEAPIRLTQMVSCAGCAAKLDPTMLAEILGNVQWPQSDQVMVGFEDADDAGVFVTDDGT